MRLLNTTAHYGLLTVLFHWLTAGLVIFLFASGLYMTSLGYYDPGYHFWPVWHKQLGIVLAAVFILRFAFKLLQNKVKPLASHASWEVMLAKLMHWLLYLMITIVLVTGYLIATSKGEGIDFFGWFKMPAIWAIGEKADWVGEVHLYVAIALIVAVILHALAAIKHSLIDKDKTVGRIFGK